MMLDELLERLERVKRRKDGYTARCPAHDDRTPSLSVGEEDGKILVRCHAGCTAEQIVRALGLSMTDLFSEPRKTASTGGRGDGARPTLVAEYVYRDEQGNPEFKTLRMSDKSFAAQHLANGVWVGRLGNKPKLLYRLPELVADPSVRVYVVEGEKDADSCAARGLVATTNPFGAGKFLPEHAEVLRGREVVVVQDKDDAGRAHGKSVVELLAGVAASVQLVEAKEGKDATDHFEAGFGADDFIEVVPQEGESELVRSVCLADVPARQVGWLWFPYIPLDEPTILAGDGGVGKTYLAMAVAAAVTTGRELPGAKGGQPANVLYVTAEDSPSKTIRPRFERLGGDCTRLHVLELDVVEVSGEQWLDVVIREALRHSARLIILDPIQAFAKAGADINSLIDARAEMRRFKRICTETGAAVLLIAHLNKMVGARAHHRVNGSVDLVNAARSVLIAGRVERDDGEVTVMGHSKANYSARGATWCYEVDGEGFRWLETLAVTADEISAGAAKPNKVKEAAEFLSERLCGGAVPESQVEQDAQSRGIAKGTLRRAKKLLGVESTRELGSWWWSLGSAKGQGAQTDPRDCDEHLGAIEPESGLKQGVLAVGDEHLDEPWETSL